MRSFVETLVRDLRYAGRTLRRDAALTTFAILIIGVGVGASTTVFGVVADSGEDSLQVPVSINLSALCQDTADRAAELAAAKGIAVATETSDRRRWSWTATKPRSAGCY